MRLPFLRWINIPKVWLIMPLAATLALSACTGQGSQSPTQTPIVVIVTGETPGSASGNTPTNGTPPPGIFPTPSICDAEIVEQSFEHGRMFWIGKTPETRCQVEQDFSLGSGEIWVAIFDENGRGGEWLIFDDDWVEGVDPESDPDLIPPEDLLQPVRGFGKVWREKLSAAQRESLGWAMVPEIKFVTKYRYEAGGLIDTEGQYVPRPGLHVLLSFGDERFYFDEPSQTFDYIPAE